MSGHEHGHQHAPDALDGHGHENGHHHHHPHRHHRPTRIVAATPAQPGFSLLLMSLPARLGTVLAASALIWALILGVTR